MNCEKSLLTAPFIGVMARLQCSSVAPVAAKLFLHHADGNRSLVTDG